RRIIVRGNLHQERIAEKLSQALLPMTKLTGLVPGNDCNQLRAAVLSADAIDRPTQDVAILARAMVTAGDDLEAERLLRAALRTRPGDVVLLNILGILLERHHPPRWQEAAECYRAIRAVRPELGLNLARVQGLLGNWNESIGLLEELERQQPDNPVLVNMLGVTLSKRGYPMKKAEGLFRKAIELKPDESLFRYNLGVALGEQRRQKDEEA